MGSPELRPRQYDGGSPADSGSLAHCRAEHKRPVHFHFQSSLIETIETYWELECSWIMTQLLNDNWRVWGKSLFMSMLEHHLDAFLRHIQSPCALSMNDTLSSENQDSASGIMIWFVTRSCVSSEPRPRVKTNYTFKCELGPAAEHYWPYASHELHIGLNGWCYKDINFQFF